MQGSDWSTSHSYQFWNKNFTSAVNVNNTTTLKTIYDPSVSGFTLPQTAAFTSFTYSGEWTENVSDFNVNGNYNMGWNFYTNGWKKGNTIFFHGLGYRNTNSNQTGTAYSTGIFYWMSGAHSTDFGRDLAAFSNAIYPQDNYNRSHGFCVRSVKE